MATPLLDIIGLYEWDNSIFDLMVLPESLEDDRETIIQNILYECRELEIAIPSPTAIKQLIKIWSKKRLYYWEELYKTTQYEYNPIDNYDRHEEITDTLAGNNNSHIGTTLNRDGTDKTKTTRKGTNTHDDELKVAGYNESNYQNSDKHVIVETPDLTDETVNTPDIEERTQSTEVGTVNNINEHVAHIWGNIGVTTAMKMIEEQRNIINISIIELIGKDFKNEFCILIY